MGCCASRPQGGDASNAIRAHSSSRNITAPSTRQGSLHSPRGSHASHGFRPDPIERPNTPLKAIPMFARSKLPNALPSPTTPNRGRVVGPLTDSTNLTWTRSRLEKERTDWWDTQVTGSLEVWGAIRLAAQSLQLGKMREAQQWLETMECTCPTGSLWKGVYDKTGVLYKVPEWLIVEPEGLVPEDAGDEVAGESAGAAAGQDAAQEADDEEDDEPVVVRARISRTGRDVVLKLQKRTTVASIVEKIKEQAELGPTTNIRLVYGGRVYQNHETLESHSFWDYANDYVLNVLVLE